jgi:two-component system, LuxR family, sensor kinase FixL
VIDHRGRIEQFSLSSERIFGYSAAEVIGKNVDVLMPKPYQAEHDAYMDRYQATGEAGSSASAAK